MSTHIAKLGRERTLATLVKRVYEIPDGATPELLRRAEAQLLAANPRLATGDGFALGASILVPAVQGLKRLGPKADAEISGEGITTELAARLEALQSRIDDAFHRSALTRRETLERLGDRAFVTEARKALPQVTEFMSAAKARLAREEGEEGETAERLKRAVGGALEGLKELDALMRRDG